jgi:transcription elongation factor GreA
MSDEAIPMTPSGLVRLKDELRRLKAEDRPRIVREIEEARAHGDLSENAEYHAAKERQSHIEGRIKMIEDRIARARVIDVSRLDGDKVVFGATVKLEEADSGDEVTYRIVGELEADLKKGRISITSPIARALIGHEVGDSVKFRTPGGEREYEILDVAFIEDEETEADG